MSFPMPTVTADDFLGRIRYLPPGEQAWVRRALERATQIHAPQRRDSGEPFILHPISVAAYLAGLEAGAVTLAAALLHDTIEDADVTAEQLAAEFGSEVALLVEAVSKLSKLRYEGHREGRQIGSLRKMLLSASQDLRVIVIKLADRWHNIETIDGLRPDKRVRVANETLDIYVPFARLMGLYELKNRFEEVCFPIAMPEAAAEWHARILTQRDRLMPERQQFLEQIDAQTTADVRPVYTPMTDYELYTKLQANIDRLAESSVLDSILLVVEREDPVACYQVLGQVHARYPVRSLSFRDYMSVPQPNGYRALHTTVFLSPHHQVLLRIQPRRLADFVTKRKMSSWLGQDSGLQTALASLLHLPLSQPQFMDGLKSSVLAERMNVFTVSGDVVNLPIGSTGIDLVFTISPDNLRYLAAVRINGEVREATARLHDSDTVEPILHDADNPSVRSQWVMKAKSVEAKEALRDNLASSPRAQQISEGASVFAAECRKRALPSWWIGHSSSLQQRLATALAQSSYEDVLAKTGTGELLVSRVADVYRDLLVVAPSLLQKLLKCLGIMPRSRKLQRETHTVRLELTAVDRKGLIYDISRAIAERDINIAEFRVYALPSHDALYRMTLEFEKFKDYSNLFDALLDIPSVKDVRRRK